VAAKQAIPNRVTASPSPSSSSPRRALAQQCSQRPDQACRRPCRHPRRHPCGRPCARAVKGSAAQACPVQPVCPDGPERLQVDRLSGSAGSPSVSIHQTSPAARLVRTVSRRPPALGAGPMSVLGQRPSTPRLRGCAAAGGCPARPTREPRGAYNRLTRRSTVSRLECRRSVHQNGASVWLDP
jgi:hypothetical protein